MTKDWPRGLRYFGLRHSCFLCHSPLARWFLFGGFLLDWHFISRGHLVFRFGRAEEPVVKPTNNILQTLDPMPRLTEARELVRLVREPHHHRRDFPELERAEHFLAARARRRSVLGLTQHKHPL